MSVAVMSTECLYVVESPHDKRAWFAMPIVGHQHYRGVFVKCKEHHVEWWKTLVRDAANHEGRLRRLFSYFHREGGHVATVFKPTGGKWQVEHHLQGDRFENVYSPSNLYTVTPLDDPQLHDSTIVQRYFDQYRKELDLGYTSPALLLPKLKEMGFLDGVVSTIEFH